MAGNFMDNVNKTLSFFKRNGLKSTVRAVSERMGEEQVKYTYAPIDKATWDKQRKESSGLYEASGRELAFSILVPLYRTDAGFLREMITSVEDQSYPYWELILVDSSPSDVLKICVEKMTGQWKDQIHYIHLGENGGIAKNTNEAFRYAQKKYVGFLDHDDTLTTDALFEMAKAVIDGKKKETEYTFLYSDEDKWSGADGDYYDVNRKTDFNMDHILSNNYICHFLVMHRDLFEKNPLRSEYDGAQDFDLVLRTACKMAQTIKGSRQICHVPKVLYHWRCHANSASANPQAKAYAYEAGKRALQDYADNNGIHATVEELAHVGFYNLVYQGEIFESRPDVGAVGGPVGDQNDRIISGSIQEDGYIDYVGKYMDSDSLYAKDTYALDIRNLRVREECRMIFAKATGYGYFETEDGYFDTAPFPRDVDYEKLSLAFGKAMEENGYRMLWYPKQMGPADPEEFEQENEGGNPEEDPYA